MGSIRVRHVVPLKSGYYFQATPAMRKAGIFSEPLGKDPAKAAGRADELNRRWDEARAVKPPERRARGTVAWLKAEFEKSEWYTSLNKRTQTEIDYHLERVEKNIGKAMVTQIGRRHCRNIHTKVMETKSRDNANRTIKWLRRLLSYAVELDLIKENPAFNMQLRHSKPRRQRWAAEQVATFKETAIAMGRRNWALGVQIGYDTSQRLSDILRATWTDFDGEGVYFRQSKGDQPVWCPLDAETLRMLGETDRRAIQILVGDFEGKPIRSPYFFNKIFRAIRAKAGLPTTLQFRDLRRTAASEILEQGGRAEPITGHRPGSSMLRIYEVPNKNAARNAQRIRRGKSGTKFENEV